MKVDFIAKPADNCEIGKSVAKLSICEKESGVELFSVPFEIRVVDYVFDHISRPLVLKLTTIISGLGALALFILTLFGQVDTTLGLASGTAISAVSVVVFMQFNSLFQRLHGSSGNP
jgi:hypothetical protein